MRKLWILSILLIAGLAHAGNVYNYSPDVPLIETQQGFREKIVYLCEEVRGDLSKYTDASIEDFIHQCKATGVALKNSSVVAQQFRSGHLGMLRSCENAFRTELRNRQTPVNSTPAYRPTEKAVENPIEVSNIQVRITKYDSIGNVWFSIKGDVRNRGQAGQVIVRLQGIDSDGYELKTVRMGDFTEQGRCASSEVYEHGPFSLRLSQRPLYIFLNNR